MLDMNTLIPEIFVGVGAAIFVGSLLALLRQRTPSGLTTKHPSHRPRAVADEQLPKSKADEPADAGAVSPDSDKANEARNKKASSNDNEEAGNQAYRLRRARTIFFMISGFIVTVWGIATILTRG